jgi:hypothetical protein
METKKAHSSEKLTFLIENSVKIVTIYFKKIYHGPNLFAPKMDDK